MYMLRIRIFKIKKKKIMCKTNGWKGVKELIETEERYVTLLEKTIIHYMRPMDELRTEKWKGQVISENEHRQLFSDLQIIFSLNEQLLKDMKQRFENWDNDKSKIGDLLLDFIPYFKMYQNYFNNYDNVNTLLLKLNNKRS
ncbi:rhoGEF domain-containing protein, partial [Reticulomyxa filosa]